MGIKITRLAGALGAELTGADLSAPSTEQTEAIREAFLEHLVLVIPDQILTPSQQIAFTRLFGPVEPHPLGSRAGREGFPEVLVLENKPGKRGARNDFWHSDISFAAAPPAASVLYALEVTEGCGDTMFCNMYAAYEGLSPGLRRTLGSLTALHTSEKLVERSRDSQSDALPIAATPPPVEHPVVRTHPESGRAALFVNPYFTSRFADMTVEESRPLLDFLYQEATRPENVFRHHWRRGEVVIWDNRCAMHYGVYDYSDTQPRLMNRTTAQGDRPR